MLRKILVVEDNEDLARLLDLHLRDLQYPGPWRGWYNDRQTLSRKKNYKQVD